MLYWIPLRQCKKSAASKAAGTRYWRVFCRSETQSSVRGAKSKTCGVFVGFSVTKGRTEQSESRGS